MNTPPAAAGPAPGRKPLRTVQLRSIPLGFWLGMFGFLGLLANVILDPGQFGNPWISLLATANIVFLSAAPRWPILAWVGFLTIATLLACFPELRIPALVFSGPVLVGITAYLGHIRSTSIFGLVLAYIGTIDPQEGTFYPTYPTEFFIWFGILAGSFAIGRIVRQLGVQRIKLVEQWQQDVESRRQETARTLHDSVATSLTSIVMRAEALSLRRGVDEEVGDQLTAIADEARTSMSEVRSLLRVLSEDSSPRKPGAEPPIHEQLSSTAQVLRSHGFDVTLSTEHTRGIGNADVLVSLKQILREIIANIIKYAEPGSTVAIEMTREDGRLELYISNKIRHEILPENLSSGLGLANITELASSFGGKLRTITHRECWRTEITFPRR